MKRSVRILRRAQHDLLQVRDYIAREAPNRAESFVGALIDTIESLETMAERSLRFGRC